jgi:hypothetical protein
MPSTRCRCETRTEAQNPSRLRLRRDFCVIRKPVRKASAKTQSAAEQSVEEMHKEQQTTDRCHCAKLPDGHHQGSFSGDYGRRPLRGTSPGSPEVLFCARNAPDM